MPAADVYQLATRVHRHIGFQKIRLGAMLCVLEESGEWRGRTAASSFRGFLQEEGIYPQAARQYMKVARKFILELDMSPEQLRAVSRASMRVLCAAADVATRDNLDELVDLVATLPRPEAMEEIRLRFGGGESAEAPFSKPVGRILNEVGELTQTQRAELFSRLGMRTASARTSNAS
ncbi:hypothetical protein SAMN06265795_12925 [Noviherbaspirillum humi]|uniref:Uncharacterized protein n=2 Tax=Noviherbaspirillum humi TaxID=1688639 RepID=A0A239M191_9BURK|nr:hypothetical protein SAMN06265795_12925 [Noviherbaspirillum humi]